MQNQINERIAKFEKMVGEISAMVLELNQPRHTAARVDLSAAGFDEAVLKAQIKNLLKQAKLPLAPPSPSAGDP